MKQYSKHLKTGYFIIGYLFAYIIAGFLLNILYIFLNPLNKQPPFFLASIIIPFVSFLVAGIAMRLFFTLPVSEKKIATIILVIQLVLTLASVTSGTLKTSFFAVVGNALGLWIFSYGSLRLIEWHLARKRQVKESK